MVDPYVDPDTDVLHNRLGLADAGALERAEADFTNARALELVDSPIGGAFDFDHLRGVHRHLFQDVYEWAGEPRTVAIAKSDLFCLSEHIEAYAADVFGGLAAEGHLVGLGRREFIESAAHHFANVNALHPFRDGNGRCQRAFFSELANHAGWDLAWERLDRTRNDRASRAAMRGDERELIAAIGNITDWRSRDPTRTRHERGTTPQRPRSPPTRDGPGIDR